MAKDKKISELSGISPAAVMGLNRSGIVTVNDLVLAEFDKVAYLLEDYNEAARLLKEARKIVDSRRGRNASEPQQAAPQPPTPTPAPEIPGPLGQKVVPVNGASASGAPEPLRPGKPQLTRIPAPPPSDTSLQQAMTVATRGLHLSDQRPGDDSRSTLARRLSVAGLLLRHGASEAEVIAGLILEPAESGSLSADDVGLRFGPRVERVLEECASLRAVPMLPSGKLPRYYLDMARTASLPARRVCASYVPFVSEGPHGVSGPVYARLLCEALEAGGPDELIAACRAALETGARAAA
jgi:hypothetical protein